MVITPLVSDWSVLEGQIIDITVDRMFDVYGNRQSSPITWSAYVRRNEVIWFTDDGDESLTIEKQINDPYGFNIIILNKGGKKQPYSIENIPQWLSASNATGTLDPNSSNTIRFQIAPELTIGEYTQDLYLNTDFNFDEKIVLNLRVLGKAPDWKIDPADFENNMNIIGKIKINGVFSQDPYCKVAAFAGNELRGVANLEYDINYDEYILYLNVFSNTSSGEDITFKIWDASTGKIYQATSETGFVSSNVITVNNDGANDYWIVQDVFKYNNHDFKIFDANGRILYESIGYKNDWNGHYKGAKVARGKYYFVIKDSDTNTIIRGDIFGALLNFIFRVDEI